MRISTKRENIRKYHIEVTELKNTTKLKTTLEGFNSRLEERTGQRKSPIRVTKRKKEVLKK